MIIILFGAPGAGKGTQAELLVKDFGFKSISTGDLLRSEIKKGSELGLKIQSIVSSGSLVDDTIIIKMVEEFLQKNSDTKNFILDGFPRTLVQAEALDKKLESLNHAIDFVFDLEVNKESLVSRIINRFICSDCGAGYNKLYKNTKVDGVCDNCGSKNLTVRKDDNRDTVLKRFDEYKNHTSKLLPYYKDKGVLYKIDGNKGTSEIHKEILSILKNVLT